MEERRIIMVDLKLLRVKNNHMTQTQLSDISGVNRATISKIEQGIEPSVQVAKKLAAALSVDWRLFYDEDY